MAPFPAVRLPGSPLSPAARAMRLQRIFARLQEGAGYPEIAAAERISRRRLHEIIRRAAALRREADQPDHARMQIARLAPALRLAAAGVAEGDARAVPLLLSLVDRLDRYSDPDTPFRSSSLEEFAPAHSRPRRIAASPHGTRAARPAGEASGTPGGRRPASISGEPSP